MKCYESFLFFFQFLFLISEWNIIANFGRLERGSNKVEYFLKKRKKRKSVVHALEHYSASSFGQSTHMSFINSSPDVATMFLYRNLAL